MLPPKPSLAFKSSSQAFNEVWLESWVAGSTLEWNQALLHCREKNPLRKSFQGIIAAEIFSLKYKEDSSDVFVLLWFVGHFDGADMKKRIC